MFKRVFRHFIDREVGVLGDEIERAGERMRDYEMSLAALTDRFERLQNRVGMRLARGERKEVVEQLRAAPEPAERNVEDPNEWPEVQMARRSR